MGPKSRVDIIIGSKLKPGGKPDSKVSPPNPMASSDWPQHIEGSETDPEMESHAEALIDAVKDHDAAGVVSAFQGLMECCNKEEDSESPSEESDEGE